MSEFTGKCDFKDTVEMFDLASNPDVVVRCGGEVIPVEDYPLYYTRLVACMGVGYKEGGGREGTVTLTEEDYNSVMNREHLVTIFWLACRDYRKRGRRGAESTVDEVASDVLYIKGDAAELRMVELAVGCRGRGSNGMAERAIAEEGLLTSSYARRMNEYKEYINKLKR